jgi:hypothetical protein
MKERPGKLYRHFDADDDALYDSGRDYDEQLERYEEEKAKTEGDE